MNSFLSVLLWLAWVGVLWANEFADQAEYDRIVLEMKKMEKNGIWAGVNKRFQDIEELEVQIEFEHYVLGAQAAQELGNILECKQRLAKALEIKPKRKQTRQWYTTIENDYGYVTLSASRKDAFLNREDAVLDPVHGQAISFAQSVLEKKGKFEGMLPIGNYNFTGQEFLLEAGVSVQLDLSPRMRRLNLKKKQKQE